MKFLMIGDPGVGKSSVLLRYTDNEFTENFISTIGVDFKERSCPVEDVDCNLQIWDTAGQERFRTITSSYYRGSHGIVVVFDLTNPQTFNAIPKWLQEIERYAEEDVSLILVGNKCDLPGDRRVSYEQAMELATKYNLKYLECSAKTGDCIDEVFRALCVATIERLEDAT